MVETGFSHRIRVSDIPSAGKTIRLVTDAKTLADLAHQLGIQAVENLCADIELLPAKGRTIRMRGSVDGDVVQICIVTLEPVRQSVSEKFDVVFLPEEAGKNSDQKTVLLDPLEDEDSETYQDGMLDLGRIVAEHLALGIDPYPRAPATDFPGHIEDDTSDRVSPFEGLKSLKDK